MSRENRCRCAGVFAPFLLLLAIWGGGVPCFAAQPLAAAVVEPADTAARARAALHTRLYYGMWSTHLRDINRGLSSNSLIGVSYRGYYAGTFINSFGDRAVSAGIQRSFSRAANRSLNAALGYRAGLVTGYDERFFGIGDKTPVIPFVQLLGNLDYRNLGLELGYAGIVASVALNLRL